MLHQRRDQFSLAIIGLIFAVSVLIRLSPRPLVDNVIAITSQEVEIGENVFIPRSEALAHDIVLPGCMLPARLRFVEVSPYGADPSLEGSPTSEDVVSYSYHGWRLGRRIAPPLLNIIYFLQRGLGVAKGLPRQSPDLAIKVVVPADCDFSPSEVIKIFTSLK